MQAGIRTVAALSFCAAIFVGCSSSTDPKGSPSPSSTETHSMSPSPSTSANASLAAAFAGTYEGTWVNTTFGSTGKAKVVFTPDVTAGTFSLTVDFDGNVFGNPDPASESFEGTLDGSGSFEVDTKAFGPVKVTITPTGSIAVLASDVPGTQIKSATSEGTIAAGAVSMKTTILFADGTKANGTIELKKK